MLQHCWKKLTNFTRLSVDMGVSRYWPNFHFWTNCSFKKNHIILKSFHSWLCFASILFPHLQSIHSKKPQNKSKHRSRRLICLCLCSDCPASPCLCLFVLIHGVRKGWTGLYFTLRTGQEKPVHMVVCVSLPSLLLATSPVTVINELSCVIPHPSLCTPQPTESATSYLVSRICVFCVTWRRLFSVLSFVAVCTRELADGGWAVCFANSPLLLE